MWQGVVVFGYLLAEVQDIVADATAHSRECAKLLQRTRYSMCFPGEKHHHAMTQG